MCHTPLGDNIVYVVNREILENIVLVNVRYVDNLVVLVIRYRREKIVNADFYIIIYGVDFVVNPVVDGLVCFLDCLVKRFNLFVNRGVNLYVCRNPVRNLRVNLVAENNYLLVKNLVPFFSGLGLLLKLILYFSRR